METWTPEMASDTSISRADIVGRGIDFPFAVDLFGSVQMTSGDDVDAAIRMIVMTAPGERVMRPDFGCAIWDHVFSPVNVATLGQMAYAVRQALARWEPRIIVEQVRVIPRRDEISTVDIAIDYELRATNDVRNLVFPFYTIGDESS